MATCTVCGGTAKHGFKTCLACAVEQREAWIGNMAYEPIDATRAIPQPTKRTGPWSKEITPRPAMHLSRIAGKFPKFWKQFEAFRAQRSKLGDWPGWCYCPVAGAYAIVSGGSSAQLPIATARFVPELAALSAWRPTKGVYRFDPDLFEALVDTPVAGDLPVEVLFRLPEWSVYVETRGRLSFHGSPVHGFFAHLEHDVNDGRSELRVLLDCASSSLIPYIVHLGCGTIQKGLEWMAEAAKVHNDYALPESAFSNVLSDGVPILSKCISLLLYLCSEEADYAGAARPSRTEQRSRGGKIKGREAPVLWDVGVRVGASLRKARQESAEPAAESADGSHASPRPHFRRAHWHLYWTGKGRTTPLVRWVSPVLVGTETIATIRKVG